MSNLIFTNVLRLVSAQFDLFTLELVGTDNSNREIKSVANIREVIERICPSLLGIGKQKSNPVLQRTVIISGASAMSIPVTHMHKKPRYVIELA